MRADPRLGGCAAATRRAARAAEQRGAHAPVGDLAGQRAGADQRVTSGGEEDDAPVAAHEELGATRDPRRRDRAASAGQPRLERLQARRGQRPRCPRVLGATGDRAQRHGQRREQHDAGPGEHPTPAGQHRADAEHRRDRGVDGLQVTRPQPGLGRREDRADQQPREQSPPAGARRAVAREAAREHDARDEQRAGELEADPRARARPAGRTVAAVRRRPGSARATRHSPRGAPRLAGGRSRRRRRRRSTPTRSTTRTPTAGARRREPRARRARRAPPPRAPRRRPRARPAAGARGRATP